MFLVYSWSSLFGLPNPFALVRSVLQSCGRSQTNLVVQIAGNPTQFGAKVLNGMAVEPQSRSVGHAHPLATHGLHPCTYESPLWSYSFGRDPLGVDLFGRLMADAQGPYKHINLLRPWSHIARFVRLCLLGAECCCPSMQAKGRQELKSSNDDCMPLLQSTRKQGVWRASLSENRQQRFD